MLNFSKVIQTPSGTYFEGICLSTDEKPVVGYANGCKLTELNLETGAVKIYCLDAANAQWVEVIDSDSELPPLPEEDGEYSLLLTITDGEPVLTWEAEETPET